MRNVSSSFNRFSPFVSKSRNLIAIHGGKFAIIGGYFDFSFMLYVIDHLELRCVDRVFDHLDVVTCIAISNDGRWLATGSRDLTVRLWEIKLVNDALVITRDGRRILYGHDASVMSGLT